MSEKTDEEIRQEIAELKQRLALLESALARSPRAFRVPEEWLYVPSQIRLFEAIFKVQIRTGQAVSVSTLFETLYKTETGYRRTGSRDKVYSKDRPPSRTAISSLIYQARQKLTPFGLFPNPMSRREGYYFDAHMMEILSNLNPSFVTPVQIEKL